MAASSLTSDADVAHIAAHSPAPHENAEAMPPDFIELVEKPLVIFDRAHLVRVIVVILQRPVWRRCDDKVYAFVGDEIQLTRVCDMKTVSRLPVRLRPLQMAELPVRVQQRS